VEMTYQKLVMQTYANLAKIPRLRHVLYALTSFKRVVFLDQEIEGTNATILPDGTVIVVAPNLQKNKDDYYQAWRRARLLDIGPESAFLVYLLVHEATHLLFLHYPRAESLKRQGVPSDIVMLAAELECSAVVSQVVPLPLWSIVPQDYGFAINASMEEMALQLYKLRQEQTGAQEQIEEMKRAWEQVVSSLDAGSDQLPGENGGEYGKGRGAGGGDRGEKSDAESPGRGTREIFGRGKDSQDYTLVGEDQENERGAGDTSGKSDLEEDIPDGTVIHVDKNTADEINGAVQRLARSIGFDTPAGKQLEIEPMFLLPPGEEKGAVVHYRIPLAFVIAARRHIARSSPAFAGWEKGEGVFHVSTDPVGEAISVISEALTSISALQKGTTWKKPNRRLMRWYVEEGVYTPGRGEHGIRLGIVVDTSGSMWPIVDQAISMAYHMRGDDVWIVPCDVQGYRPRRKNELTEGVEGGGGTYLWKGVRALYNQEKYPFLPREFSAIIVISDGYSNLPSEEEVEEFWLSLARRNIPIPKRYFIALVSSQESIPNLAFWEKAGFTTRMVLL